MSVPTINVSDSGELSTLNELAIAIREAVSQYPHYVVIDGFPSYQQPEYFITISRCIGAAMEVDPVRSLLDESAVSFTRVTVDPEKAAPGGDATRYSRTRLPLNPHTDSSYRPLPHEIVGFQCVVADESGGETVMVPLEDILQNLEPDTIALLREPIYPFGQGRYAILSGNGESTQIRYYRTQIDHSLELEGSSLPKAHQAALKKLDIVLEQLASRTPFEVHSGQILLMHNHKVLHGRTALGSESDRLLYRIRFHANSLQSTEPTIPGSVEAHLSLAAELEQLDRFEAAATHYHHATMLTNEVEVLNIYGNFLLRRGNFTEAIDVFRKSIALDPQDYDGGLSLASIADYAGDQQESEKRLKQVLRYHPYRPEEEPDPQKPTILRLRGFEAAAYGIVRHSDGSYRKLLQGGHFSTDHLFNHESYNIDILNLFEDNLNQVETLPKFDLFLNTIACPDSKQDSLKTADQLILRYPHVPVINPPRLVLETTRERNSFRLNTISGVTFPRTEKFWWDGVASEQVVKKIMDAEFEFPVIVREVGTQTGQTVALIQDKTALQSHFEGSPPNRAYYVIQFKDCSIQPDVFHKMRIFFVDGVLYPVANVFHNAWNIHSGDRYSVMDQQEWMQEEEKKFLNDPRSYLGHDKVEKLYAVRDLIQLDFFGMDFTVLQDGTLFIFELNAAMRHNYDHVRTFPYTRPYLERISHSFDKMLQERLCDLAAKPQLP
jgi:tetratricopeptide (TPR) repeat protein